MNCPVCKEPMIILEYNTVEVDYCVSCHGIWLDAGELELLFGSREITAGFLTAGDPAVGNNEKKRPCPICDRKMKKATTDGEHPVVYDECPRNHGLWFDKGELATILKYGSAAEGGDKVVGWLQDMFGEEEDA